MSLEQPTGCPGMRSSDQELALAMAKAVARRAVLD
jgi:hypothetical protein